MNIETTGEHFNSGINPSAATVMLSPIQNPNEEFLTGWGSDKKLLDRELTPEDIMISPPKLANGVVLTPTNLKGKIPLPTKVYHHDIPQIKKSDIAEHVVKSTRLTRTDHHTNRTSDRFHKSAVLSNTKSEAIMKLNSQVRKSSVINKPAPPSKLTTQINRSVSKQNIVSPKAVIKTPFLLNFQPKLKPKHNRSVAELNARKTFYMKKDPFSIYNSTDESYYQIKKNKSQSHRPEGDVGIFYDEIDFDDKHSSMNQRHTSHNAKRYYQATSTGSQYSRKTYFGISMIKEEPGNVLQKVQGGLDNKLIKSSTLKLDPLEMNERARIVKEYLQKISQKKVENNNSSYGGKLMMAQSYEKIHSPRTYQTQQHYFNARNIQGLDSYDQNSINDIPSYYNATFNNQSHPHPQPQSQSSKLYQPNKTTLAMITSPMPKSPTLEAWEDPMSLRK